VDKAGIVNLCYVQKPRKDLELKVTAAINTGNLSGATAHKWGMSLSCHAPAEPCLLSVPGCCTAAVCRVRLAIEREREREASLGINVHDECRARASDTLRACAGVQAIMSM